MTEYSACPSLWTPPTPIGPSPMPLPAHHLCLHCFEDFGACWRAGIFPGLPEAVVLCRGKLSHTLWKKRKPQLLLLQLIPPQGKEGYVPVPDPMGCHPRPPGSPLIIGHSALVQVPQGEGVDPSAEPFLPPLVCRVHQPQDLLGFDAKGVGICPLRQGEVGSNVEGLCTRSLCPGIQGLVEGLAGWVWAGQGGHGRSGSPATGFEGPHWPAIRPSVGLQGPPSSEELR